MASDNFTVNSSVCHPHRVHVCINVPMLCSSSVKLRTMLYETTKDPTRRTALPRGSPSDGLRITAAGPDGDTYNTCTFVIFNFHIQFNNRK